MADQSLARSARFQVLFESALQAYKKRTGITLAEHPLTVELESCHSRGRYHPSPTPSRGRQ